MARQWDVVKKLTAHAATHGSGHNYLVMASAGSGKSNTIGWLAHRLSSLHTPTNPAELDPDALANGLKPGAPVFDKVIIITDRRNLDSQLRETVGSFEQTAGLVVKIDEKYGAKSEQLAKALSQETGKIVTVTLHTFPALLDYLRRNPTEIKGSRFAIVVDEAHSSHSGDAASDVRKVLRGLGLDADDDSGEPGAVTAEAEDSTDAKLKKRAEDRGQSPNLSYFAFTATPKAKTLENFGELTEHDGKATHVPFHTYSMRQAIEEGFILDPLHSYVTYNTYWKLVNENPDDKEVDPRKANPLLARAALMHASTVARQAQVIVEHFRMHTAGRLGGRAKAMVVTASRLVESEMRAFAEAFLAAEEKAAGSPAKWAKLHAELYRHTEPAVARFTELADHEDEDEQETAENFRSDLNDYVRKYGFLSQIVPYHDPELEQLYLFGRHLLNRLPRRHDGSTDIGDVDLSHLKVEKTGEHDLSLVPEGPALMKGFGDGAAAAQEPEKSLLSELIEKFNEKHGTDLTEKDALKPFEEAYRDPKVRQAAMSNDEENFGIVFDPVFEDKMAEHIDTVADLGRQYFASDKTFRKSLNSTLRSAAWRMIRREEGVGDDLI
ncbi:DEAD/DEAH box helicase [Saccharopolyspora antimicrobica]|uniref:DEAD/DEAH box helicase n=1 Tax=Saccharopolyspora antimicrobica TaxID=455193 RepID=A0A1I4ZQ92_9PSEU|nr:DEAD/DEAH box helicase [Saccharopolyspora antimicrobica]RKT83450.1 RAD3-like DEAD/DEAH box helicase [Saccharopolyspora antimicrobica]SFN52149.1 DEAD/DEAH box helicase [Saccharopolyspora antimicrobica]